MPRTSSFALVLLVVSCRSSDRAAAPPPSPSAAAVSPATAADLARDLDDADRRAAWTDVKQRWQGRRIRWNVTRVRALCNAPDACHVAVLSDEYPARHGWLPGLSFAPGAFAALASTCGAKDPCAVAIEGTIAELVAAPDKPQSVRLVDVTLAGDRVATR